MSHCQDQKNPKEDYPNNVNQRYVAGLAMAAAVVLVGGYLLRPRKEPKHVEPPVPVQPQPLRGSDVRQISDFLSERARRVAAFVVPVSGRQASGVLWPTGQVITAASGSAIVEALPSLEPPPAQPIRLAAPEASEQAGWMVIVARNSEGQPISTPGILGGAAEAACGPERVRKLLFSVPLDAAFAGGGVFDISGALLGVVVQCSGSWTAITHQSVQALLEKQIGAPAVAWHSFGVRTREPAEAERNWLRVPRGGLFVSEVRLGSDAANMGLRPGDLLISSGGEALERPEDLLTLSDTLLVWRERRRLRLRVSPEFSLDQSAAAPVLTSLRPGSRAHTAGLQPGDRVLDPRLLQSNRTGWLIYQRGERYAGVLLP